MIGILAAIELAISTVPNDSWHFRLLRDQLDRDLRDYPTARFRDVYAVVRETKDGAPSLYFCGSINSRDSHGAYTGWRTFSGSVNQPDNALSTVVTYYQDASVLGSDAQSDDLTLLVGTQACAVLTSVAGGDVARDISEIISH